MWRLGGFVLAATVAAALLAGCGGEDGPSVVVEPETSVADEPLRITVRGLEPNQAATLELQSTDGAGVRWASSAAIRADGDGLVELARPAARSPASPPASGTDLVSAMKPATPSEGRYRWAERGPYQHHDRGGSQQHGNSGTQNRGNDAGANGNSGNDGPSDSGQKAHANVGATPGVGQGGGNQDGSQGDGSQGDGNQGNGDN